jgi:hypothetical protein
MMTLNDLFFIAPIMADTPNRVEQQIQKIQEYIQSVGGLIREMAVSHPNEFVTAAATCIIALFTAVLAIATIRLWNYTADLAKFAEEQSRDMKASVAASEKAAKAAESSAAAGQRAAEISERALTELEAPFVFVEIIEKGLKPSMYFPGGKLDVSAAKECLSASEIKYRFVNYGRTPARIVAVADNFAPMEKGSGAPPPIDVATQLTTEMPWGVVIPPNRGFSDIFTVKTLPQTLEDKQDLFYNPDRAAMFFLVVIRYADIFENRFLVGNCFLFDKDRAPEGGWILAKYGHPHSYRLRERKAG